MQKKAFWFWLGGLLMSSTFTFRKIFDFFSEDSPNYLYLYYLRCFDPLYWFTYALNAIQIFLNIFHLIPFALFILGIKIFSLRFWQYLLILRIIFDLVGHPYEFKMFVSYVQDDPLLCLLFFIISLIPYLPSYIACFLYAQGLSFNGLTIGRCKK